MAKEKQDIFFILGLHRSGTTLLEQMLDAHSQIAVCPEISSGMTMWRLNLSKKVKNQWKSLLMVNYYFNRARIFKDPIVSCIKHHAVREFKWPLKTSDWYSPLIEEYLLEKKARIFGEKTPENTFFIPVLNQAFPDGKYIIILRNPFDIILSLCEIYSAAQGRKITDRMLLGAAVMVKRGLKNLYKGGALLDRKQIWITYENLIRDTDRVLERICHFLGISFEASMKDIQNKKQYALQDQSFLKFILGRLDEPITDKRINRAEGILTPKQIGLLHMYLTPEINFLPYQIIVPVTQIPLIQRIRVFMAKIAFLFRLYLLKEYKNKLRFQLHYLAMLILRKTFLKKKIFKNLRSSKADWD